MASRGVSVLKFVGTVSLGLLTGLSYTLSTLTVPALLTLPSASTAAKAFHNLTTTAKTQLTILAAVSGSAFALAFAVSPRAYRHPYLLYTSLLVLGSRLVTSEFVAPYVWLTREDTGPSQAALAKARHAKRAAARAKMEASYEVLGTDSTSDGAGSEDLDTEEDIQNINGEEVRVEVEYFLKKQIVQTAVSGLGFLLAVVGIWGDGAMKIFQSETFIVQA